MSVSLWPHGLQHARPPCLSSTPGACSNSCPLSWWCHPTILSSVVPSPPTFSRTQHQSLFQWVSSSHQVAKVLEFQLQLSASASVLPMNVQDLFPLGWTDWISLKSKGLSRVFSNTTVQKHQFFSSLLSLWCNSHIHTCLLENHSFDYTTFVSQVMSLLFNMLSRFVIAFLSRSKSF